MVTIGGARFKNFKAEQNMRIHTGWLFFPYKHREVKAFTRSRLSIYEEELQSVAEQRPPVITFRVEAAQYCIALKVRDMILISNTAENQSM